MFLRWIVNNYLRQTAQRKLYEVVGGALQGRPPGGAAPDSADRTAPSSEPPPPCAAAVVFAADVEAGGFVDSLQQVQATRGASFVEFDGRRKDRRIVVVETGIGTAAAERGTADAIALLEPQWVVSAGFAGALDVRLRRGQFLLADTIVDEAGQELAVGLKIDPATIAAMPGVHLGRLLTVDRVLRDEAQRRALGERHQALACDMESMAVAQVCRTARVRFLSVRIVSDVVDQKLNREIELLLDQNSWAGKLGVAAAALVQRPSAAKELWQMREEAIKLSDRLAKFLGGVLDQLS